MSRKSQAFALRVLASEVAAGTPLSPRLTQALRVLERDPEVHSFVSEEIEDTRAAETARRSIARGAKTIPLEQIRREFGR